MKLRIRSNIHVGADEDGEDHVRFAPSWLQGSISISRIEVFVKDDRKVPDLFSKK